jgi:hypothetical protein
MADAVAKKYLVSERVKQCLKFDGITYMTGQQIDPSKVDAGQLKASIEAGLVSVVQVVSEPKK